ncbi:MAG: penicillin-binding protein, partial [Roseiflexaceae bacterium]|nr:penicillin-binding protein [Roseiflexaceae bacterium]
RNDARPVGDAWRGGETNVSSRQSPPLLITSPAHGAVFAVSPGVPVERQRIAITAGATMDIEGVTIFVNGEPVAAAPRVFWQLQPGIHRAWAEGRDADGQIVRSPIVEFEVRSAP